MTPHQKFATEDTEKKLSSVISVPSVAKIVFDNRCGVGGIYV